MMMFLVAALQSLKDIKTEIIKLKQLHWSEVYKSGNINHMEKRQILSVKVQLICAQYLTSFTKCNGGNSAQFDVNRMN